MIQKCVKDHRCNKLSTGVVASVGTIGMLIPPSIVLIIYGIIVEQSIGRLFLVGIVPGLVISFFFMCVVYGWVKIDPAIAPRAEKEPWKERIKVLSDFLWVGIIFVVVIGGLMAGKFSPTEAGTIGTVAVFIQAFVKREVNFKMLVKSWNESLRTAVMTLLLIAGSVVLGHFLAISFIDDLAFMILATPIFYPAVIKLGYDPIWFGIMIGVIIPPVAICVFIVRNITGIPFNVIYKGVLPFLLAFFACALLLFLFPQIALFLPTFFMGAG